MTNNPLLDWDLVPAFDHITPDHIYDGVRQAVEASTRALEQLEKAEVASWHNLLAPLERLTDRVARAWGLASHLHNVRNTPALREEYAKAQPLVVSFYNRLGQSRPLYDALVQLRDRDDFSRLSMALQRTITVLIRDADLQGVGLAENQRQRFNAISQELAELSTRFSNNVLDATQAYAKVLRTSDEVAGLPASSLELAATASLQHGMPEATAEAGPWTVTLDLPSFLSFMQYATRRDLREEVYRAYITRASSGEQDNLPLIKRILELRKELALLLGFDNYASLSLSRKMAPNVQAIEELLQQIRTAATEPALNDLIELNDLARAAGQTEDVAPWDVMYWTERLKEERLGLSDDVVRPYFPLPNVLNGLFGLVRELFDVEVTAVPEQPVWHPDVSYHELRDTSGQVVAGFYVDAYTRPGEKRGGAWMDDLYGRSAVCTPRGQDVRLPVAYICCNQRPPLGDTPSLMSFSEVVTLFHEMGHALQHMLTRVDNGFVSGINNIEWDAVELPSQFMENWCYHEETLKALAKHYESGAAMPAELLNKLRQNRTFRAGSNALRQISFALTDLALHTADPAGLDPLAVGRHIAQEILPMPPLPEDRFLCSFSHIFAGGYAAGYYSYKWAEVLSADAFGLFEEKGLVTKETRQRLGHKFRQTVLGLGGSRPAMEVFRLFRGRNPEVAALLRQEGLLAGASA